MEENKFSITETNGSNGTEIIVKNNSTNESFSILPDSGARIAELFLHNGQELISIIKKIENVHSESRDDVFNNAKLSPFAGRIREGKFTFNSAVHQLAKNYPEENNACHGFVYNRTFSVIEKTIGEAFASCTLEYQYQGDFPGYPFMYSIQLTYKLSELEGLTCTTKIVNDSDEQIPLSDGWHFYFDLGMDINNLKLKTENCEMMELDPHMIPTGKREIFDEFIDGKIIGDRKFDSCFKIMNTGKTETRLISEDRNLNLCIWQEAGEGKYQYFVIYTPPDRKTIAIEPMTSNINSFNNGEGLIMLNPQDTFATSFGISLNKNIY
ncbi:MAG: aldose 1-epimerase [Ignavibacteria bacterium]|nr:aldose 1-epimerase [Ignavibacteria bacterium]